jgi:hypothetical protein
MRTFLRNLDGPDPAVRWIRQGAHGTVSEIDCDQELADIPGKWLDLLVLCRIVTNSSQLFT